MTTNIELAKQVSKHVELLLVALRKAEIRTDFDPFDMPDGIGLQQQYRCSYDASEHTSHGRLSVYVDLSFAAREQTQDNEAHSTGSPDFSEANLGRELVALDATFLLTYSISSEIELTPECLEQFANVNGPYNVWPYWRELVQTASGRVGLGGITVPVFRPVVFELTSTTADSASP